VITAHDGVWGVYVKVMETGEEFLLNDGEYTAASCFKIPLSLYIYEAAAEYKIDLDTKIAFAQEDWEGGTGVLQATKPGTEFSVSELVALAMRESDNIAANMLVRTVGKDELVAFYSACGATVLPLEKNVSSPREMGVFLERMLSLVAKDPAHYGELLRHLFEHDSKNRIAARLPASVQVFNKVGSWPGVVNDVGIVVTDRCTYLICVMSKGTGPTELGEVAISDISLKVYEHIVSRIHTAKRMPDAVGRKILNSVF